MATQDYIRSSVVNYLRAGKSVDEILQLVKVSRRTVYYIKKDWETNKTTYTPTRKQHKRRSDAFGVDFVKRVTNMVNKDPGRSMRSMAREIGCSDYSVRKVVANNIGYKSYALRKGQFMNDVTKLRRFEKAKKLLNRLKHPRSSDQLIFFSDEKNFNQDQKINRKNNRWLAARRDEVPIVMSTKFPTHVMVLGVVSCEGDVMPPYFFEQGLKVTADVYLDVLKNVVVPWMKKVAAGRHFIFQQDGAPAHNAKKTQKWLVENVPELWEKEIWPPSSPDINPLDYFVWGIVERDTNRAPHTTIGSLKSKIKQVMASLDREMVRRACSSFRKRLTTVIENEGDFFE